MKREIASSFPRASGLYREDSILICTIEHIPSISGKKKINFVLKGSFEESVLLSEYAFRKGKQSLVFVSTRKGTQAEAERIGNKISKSLKLEERNKLSILATEVENTLYMHQDVLEAAVIGIPDEHWGEAVKAYVVLKEGVHATEKDIISFCKSNLTHYKAPKTVDFLKSLPRTGSGKIYKKGLRDPHLPER